MHKYCSYLLAFCCFAVPANAQGLGMGMGIGEARSGGGAAVLPNGPGDIVPMTMYWGLRAYNKTKCTGSVPAVRLRRVLDSVEADIPIGTDCDLNTPSAVTHCAGTTCTAAIVYDQVGGNACSGASCNCVQTTPANQLAFVFSCQGGKPCLQSTTATLQCGPATNFAPATGTMSLHYVGQRSSGTGGTTGVSAGPGGSRIVGVAAAANWQLASSAGTITRAAADGAWHVAAGVVAGASSSLSVDGGTTTGSVTPFATAVAPFGFRGAATTPQISMEGGIVDNAILSAGQISSLNTNARSWWAIP